MPSEPKPGLRRRQSPRGSKSWPGTWPPAPVGLRMERGRSVRVSSRAIRTGPSSQEKHQKPLREPTAIRPATGPRLPTGTSPAYPEVACRVPTVRQPDPRTAGTLPERAEVQQQARLLLVGCRTLAIVAPSAERYPPCASSASARKRKPEYARMRTLRQAARVGRVIVRGQSCSPGTPGWSPQSRSELGWEPACTAAAVWKEPTAG